MTALCRWCLDHGRNTPEDPHVYCVCCGAYSAGDDSDADWEASPRCRYADCFQGNPVASDEERVTCSECRHNMGLPHIGWKCGWPRREKCDCSEDVRQMAVRGRDILQKACPEEIPDCECDSTHDDHETVCRWCYAHGRRTPNDPGVACNTCGGSSWNAGRCERCGRHFTTEDVDGGRCLGCGATIYPDRVGEVSR